MEILILYFREFFKSSQKIYNPIMTFDTLISDLQSHAEKYPLEAYACRVTTEWIEKHREFAFVKDNLDGHIVASFWVTNPEKTKVLLMFHKRFQMWSQFWGHCDGEVDTLSVALREFHEESWVIDEPIIFDSIFSVQIWDIKERTSSSWMFQPKHQHYDILYLWFLDENIVFDRQIDEVDDIRWFDIEWIEEFIQDPKMLQMIEKIKYI